MAIRTVVTRGFGNGTFNGTIPLVTRHGYVSAAAPVSGQYTRLGVSGFSRPPYAAFVAKAPSVGGPHTPGEITRLGVSGFPRFLYGSFAGKTAAEADEELPGSGFDRIGRRGMRAGSRSRVRRI